MKNSVLTSKKSYSSTIHIGFWGMVLSVLLVFILTNSCGTLPKVSLPPGAHERPVSWFRSDTGHFLFNTSINVMKNHFSGLTVVKPLKMDNYRVIMITETGLKILDMEFFPDSLPKVHYIMEQMNRRILVRTLQKDMSIMLMNHLQNTAPVWYDNFIINPGNTALFKVNGEKYFYIMEPEQVRPSVALLGKGRKFNVEVNFFGTPDRGIDSLKLSHNNINLSIRLSRIHELK